MSNENTVRMDSNTGALGKARLAAKVLLGSPLGIGCVIAGAVYACTQGCDVTAGLLISSLAIPRILDGVAKLIGKPEDNKSDVDMIDECLAGPAKKKGKGLLARLTESLDEASTPTRNQRKEMDQRTAQPRKPNEHGLS